MLVVLAVAMIVWVGVLGLERGGFLGLARYFREQESRYAAGRSAARRCDREGH